MHRRPISRTVAATAATSAVLVAVLGLAGCGGSAADEPGSSNLTPAEAPDGWTAHTQGSVQVYAPTEWAEFDAGAPDDAGSTGSTAYGLKAPVAADGSGTGVFTIAATEPKNDAADATSVARGIGESTLGQKGGGCYFAWLFALQRLAMLLKIDEIGGENWHASGARHLRGLQRGDGSFEEKPPYGANWSVRSTTDALLFLVRATLPVTEPGAAR